MQMKNIAPILLMLIAVQVTAAEKMPLFNAFSISMPFTVTQAIKVADLMPLAGKELVIVGRDENGSPVMGIASYQGETGKIELLKQFVVPAGLMFFDISNHEGTKIQQLVFLSSSDIQVLDLEKHVFRPLLELPSIYIQAEKKYFSAMDFVKDVNGDDLDDIVVSDFRQLMLFIQQADATYLSQSLPIEARMQLNGQSPQYQPQKIFVVDMNFDQKPDIAYLQEGRVKVHYQLESGVFQAEKSVVPLGIEVSTREWWELSSGDSEGLDQSNIKHLKLVDIQDLNADGLADIIAQSIEKSGVFEEIDSFQVYMGRRVGEQLEYPEVASTAIKFKGTAVGSKFKDLNGDERADAMVASLAIGIRQIIGALITGSIKMDVSFYSMTAIDTYPEQANLHQNAQIDFSLSSGAAGSPVIETADFDGDGLEDLLTKSSAKYLRLHLGNGSSRLFEKRGVKFPVILPVDGNMLTNEDINEDGKADVLLRYGRQDDDGLQTRITVLIAN